MTTLTDAQRLVLSTFVDTVAPAMARDEDPTGFWASPGSATGAPDMIAAWLAYEAPEPAAAGVVLILEVLGGMGFAGAGQAEREAMLAGIAASGPEAEQGIEALTATMKLLCYASADEAGANPFWPAIGYPGPQASPRPDAEQPIVPYQPRDGEVLDCDVVVVGSGAGGGTIAGTLASRGMNVVVLEAGGDHSERDFRQLEVWGNQNLLYRRGPAPTADGNALLFAGATLGGGTTVNWQNWVTPTPAVRAQWAGHGLTDLATADFDRHLDAVTARVGANEDCSDYNGPHQRMIAGAQQLGWSWRRAMRNVDPARYQADLAGYTHYGDLTGSKQGTAQTYLVDAVEHGARVLTGTHADLILTEGGAATGVTATFTHPGTGTPARITVRASHVVVAGGALETPALLLRSGIGGPAVGRYLRIHPSGFVFGEYPQPMNGWWGPPQAALVDEFRETDGYGWMIENSHFHPGGHAALLPWDGGEAHKSLVERLGHMALFLYIQRERGSGMVRVDSNGAAVHTYAMDDELDQRHFRAGLANAVRLHEAAGAQRIHYPVRKFGTWTRGDDLDAWIERLQALPIGPGGLAIASAHQMGSARLGSDPRTSVARPTGELHDTRGVWIGDTSAFPTAAGANPMCTCMALARRTAENLLGRSLGDSDRPARLAVAAQS